MAMPRSNISINDKISCHPKIFISSNDQLDAIKKIKAEEISERVSEMIAMDLRLIQMVEGKGFRRLMSYLEPGYTDTCTITHLKPENT